MPLHENPIPTPVRLGDGNDPVKCVTVNSYLNPKAMGNQPRESFLATPGVRPSSGHRRSPA